MQHRDIQRKIQASFTLCFVPLSYADEQWGSFHKSSHPTLAPLSPLLWDVRGERRGALKPRNYAETRSFTKGGTLLETQPVGIGEEGRMKHDSPAKLMPNVFNEKIKGKWKRRELKQCILEAE